MTRAYLSRALSIFAVLLGMLACPTAGWGQTTACDPETATCVEFSSSDSADVRYLPTATAVPDAVALTPSCGAMPCGIANVSAGSGTVTANPDGTISYVRPYDFDATAGTYSYRSGQDTVSYTLDDGTTGEIQLFVCAAEPCSFANPGVEPAAAGTYAIEPDPNDPDARTFVYTPNLTQLGVSATLSYQVTDSTNTTTTVRTQVTNPGFGQSTNVVTVSNGASLGSTFNVTRTGSPDSNTSRYGAAWFSGDDGPSGGAASNLNVVNTGNIMPAAGQTGIVVRSAGGDGSGGENGGTRTFILIRFYGAGGNGGWGGTGGNVELINSGNVTTTHAPGIVVESIGGEGGDGGDGSGFVASGGPGGAGGRSGNVRVQNFGDVSTSGANADAIRASSLTGTGGNGGNSSGVFSDGGTAGFGVHSGTVHVESRGALTTDGDNSRGIYAQTIGGGGGNGGAGYGLVGGGADGGGAGNAGAVTVLTNNAISTDGFLSDGIYAYSLGGGGGTGGMGGGWFAAGGDGAAAGNGGVVSVTTEGGSITTLGNESVGILARSQGGGGGDGGGAVSVGAWVSVAIGGNGGDGGIGEAVTVDNAAAISTEGGNSSAIYADSLGGGGGSGGFAFSVSGGLGGSFALGVGGSGAGGGGSSTVNVGNSGTISTGGESSHGILARSQGGGGGDGGFSIAGAISDGAAVSFSVGGTGGSGGNSSDVTVGNTGAITTEAADSHGIYAKSNGGGGGDGGFSVSATVSGSASISAGIGGGGGVGGDSGIVIVGNAGAITTSSRDSHAIYAKSEGGGGGDGGFSFTGGFSAGAGVSFGIGGHGGGGGDGEDVTVDNDGTLIAIGDNSMGILAKSLGGGGGDGGFSISTAAGAGALSFSIGGFADDGGDAGDTTVINSGSIDTSGEEGIGIQASSLGGGGGTGGFSVGGNLSQQGGFYFTLGGGGGRGGDAGEVDVQNTAGLIGTSGGSAHGISATSRGGGGGDGGFSVAGSLSTTGPAIGLSIGGFGDSGGDGKSVSVTSSGNIITGGETAHGILAESLGGGGGDGGFSVAGGFTSDGGLNLSVGGFGAGGGSAGRVDVTNNGSITTTGHASSAVRAQSTGGGGGNGGFSIAGSVAFRAGGTNLNASIGGGSGDGNFGGAVQVNSDGVLSTEGASSYGIFARSVGGGGGDGGFSIAGGLSYGAVKQSNTNIGVSVGGGGGDGGLGGNVDVGTLEQRVRGSIATTGDDSQGIFAQSTGGGGGNGGMSYVINIDGDVTPSEKDISYAGSIAVGGGGGGGNEGGAVAVRTQAQIDTGGDRSDAIFAQSVGGGGGLGGGARTLTLSPSSFLPIDSLWEGNNYSFNLAIGGSGGDANLGGSVTVANDGALTTSGVQARGIFAQSVGGGGGMGGGGILAGPCDVVQDVSDAECPWYVGGLLEVLDAVSVAQKFKTGFVDTSDWSFAVGGNGGDNGHAGAVTVQNSGDITTSGLEAHGIFAQSVGGGGGLAQQYIKASNCAEGVEECSGAGGEASIGLSGKLGIGGAGGAGGNGGNVAVTNHGRIETAGVGAYGIWAQSVGGGGGAAGSVSKGFANFACESDDDGLCLEANVGVNIAYSRPGGGRGNGGAVTVSGEGDILTSGLGAIGIFAQSVGGGGGMAGDDGIGWADDAIDALRGMFVGSVGGEGHGGAVSVTQRANVITSGENAHGIFAQSSGGTDTVNAGGTVSVTVAGNVVATGMHADGIVAQSFGLGRASDITVTIEGGIIQGGLGDASGVRILDGADNSLDNGGAIRTMGGLAGTAIRATGGNETVTNTGLIIGNVDLGTGVNSLANQATGHIDSGALFALGAGNVLTNAGAVVVAGSGQIGSTLLRGDLVQSATGVLQFDVDMAGAIADRLDIEGNSTLNGRLEVNLATPAVARIREFTLLSSQGPASGAGVAFNTPGLPPALQAELLGAGTASLRLRLRPDFSLSGTALSANRSAVAEHLNAVVSAGPDQGMQHLLDRLVVLPTAASVQAALQRLQPEPLLTLAPATWRSGMRFNNVLHSCRVREDDYRFAAEGACSWSNLAGHWYDQEGTAERVGYSRRSIELTLGAQRELANGMHGGFGFAYENSSTDVSDLAELDGYQFELGAVLKNRVRATTMAGSLSLAYGRYDTARELWLPEETRITRGKQDLSSLIAGLRIAHDFGAGSWYLRPQLDVSATFMRMSSVHESNGLASDLRIGAHSETFLTLQPALEFGGEIESANEVLTRPFVRMGVTRLVSDPNVSAAARFEGTPDGVAPFVSSHGFEKTYFDGGVGLDVLWPGGASLRIAYFRQFADEAHEHTAALKLRVPL